MGLPGLRGIRHLVGILLANAIYGRFSLYSANLARGSCYCRNMGILVSVTEYRTKTTKLLNSDQILGVRSEGDPAESISTIRFRCNKGLHGANEMTVSESYISLRDELNRGAPGKYFEATYVGSYHQELFDKCDLIGVQPVRDHFSLDSEGCLLVFDRLTEGMDRDGLEVNESCNVIRGRINDH